MSKIIHRKSLSVAFASAALLGAVEPAAAMQGIDGTTYFDAVPRLNREAQMGTGGSTIGISVVVPEEGSVPLRTLVIDQARNVEDLVLSENRVIAVLGDRYVPGAETLPIQVSFEPVGNSRQIRVHLEEAIQPGSVVTIALQPQINQTLEANYLFGVTAKPDGDQPFAYFLGYTAANFYQLKSGERGVAGASSPRPSEVSAPSL